MSKTMRPHAAWIATLSVLTLAGCKDPGQPACTICPPVAAGPNYRPNTTYAAPLYNLAQAYNTRDADAVKAYLGMIGSAYQFRYYDPQSSTPTVPISWNAATEDSTATDMLRDPALSALVLTLPLADTSGAEVSSFAGDPPDTKKISIHGITLVIQKGDVSYQTSGTCDFFIAPVNNEYRIIRWEDNTAPALSVSGGSTPVRATTWGSIKAFYLRAHPSAS